VILSAGHTVGIKGAALLASGYYETPLGKVQADEALASALMKAEPLFEDKPSAHEREHAVEVQLPFLQRRLKKPFKLLAATLNTGDLKAAKAMGAALAAALKGKKALLVISTDLSHYPGADTARALDRAFALAMETMDPGLVWATSKILMEKNLPGVETCACGEAAIETGMEAARLLGAKSFKIMKLSDSSGENPEDASPKRVVGYLGGLFVKEGAPYSLELDAQQKKLLLDEARETVAASFAGKKPPASLAKDPRFNLPGAAFVTLTLGGELRGCIGTVEAVMTLLDAVRYGAYSAAFRDTRFSPLTPEELARVKFEVSILSPLKPAKGDEIKPRTHGVVVVKGGKSGLFLPQVWEHFEGKDAKDAFMGELCAQKAGLPRDCWKDPATELYTFTVSAFEEGKI
jgi:AmmeMemoRadiSam system protein A/AmmeMemoRadiSam system protein B